MSSATPSAPPAASSESLKRRLRVIRPALVDDLGDQLLLLGMLVRRVLLLELLGDDQPLRPVTISAAAMQRQESPRARPSSCVCAGRLSSA